MALYNSMDSIYGIRGAGDVMAAFSGNACLVEAVSNFRLIQFSFVCYRQISDGLSVTVIVCTGHSCEVPRPSCSRASLSARPITCSGFVCLSNFA